MLGQRVLQKDAKGREANLRIPGYQVNLISVVVWAVREMRLHLPDRTELELNLKLDGRPLWGIFYFGHPPLFLYLQLFSSKNIGLVIWVKIFF